METVRSTKATVMLAQWAQVHPNGSVNMMGGGTCVVPHELPVIFITGTLQFGWDAIGVQHKMRFELLDGQGHPVVNEQGEPLTVTGEFPIAPAPGIKRDTPLVMPLAIPVGPLKLEPGSRYEWKWELDGQSHEDWSLGFTTMPEAQSKAA